MSSSLPALLGGQPIRPQGPPAWPPSDPLVQEALAVALRDGSWGQYLGRHTQQLEQGLREYQQAEFTLACGSGTFAVELGLRALKVAAGDEVILAAYDYPGNFLTVHALGALPVLVDLDAGNWNLAVDRLEAACGPATKAVIASHLHGGLVPMRQLLDWAHSHNLAVLEDAAQAPGAMVQGRRAGSWGDAGVLSFGGSKLLCAGRGGALLTASAAVFQRAHAWFQRGNQLCPLSELQAAVLLPQLQQLDTRHAQRAASVRQLTTLLAAVPGLQPFVNRTADGQPAYYKLGWQFDAEQFGLSRGRLVEALRAEGMAFDEGFPALHVGRSPRRFRRADDLAEAQRAHHGAVILHHPVLLGSAADIAAVAQAVRKVRNHAEYL